MVRVVSQCAKSGISELRPEIELIGDGWCLYGLRRLQAQTPKWCTTRKQILRWLGAPGIVVLARTCEPRARWKTKARTRTSQDQAAQEDDSTRRPYIERIANGYCADCESTALTQATEKTRQGMS